MYCSVDEAFDKKTEENKNNNDKQYNTHKQQDPHYEDNIINYPNYQSSFFTAQGDYSSNNGTKISDLDITDNNTLTSYDDLSLLDSDYLNSSDIIQTDKKPEYSHNYCINNFIKSITKEDNMSLISSEDTGIYDHIKECKYCKNQINKKIKEHYKPTSKPQITEKFNILSEKVIGYEFKDILIIIVIGLIVIFLLDFFVKIGRKTMRLEMK